MRIKCHLSRVICHLSLLFIFDVIIFLIIFFILRMRIKCYLSPVICRLSNGSSTNLAVRITISPQIQRSPINFQVPQAHICLGEPRVAIISCRQQPESKHHFINNLLNIEKVPVECSEPRTVDPPVRSTAPYH